MTLGSVTLPLIFKERDCLPWTGLRYMTMPLTVEPGYSFWVDWLKDAFMTHLSSTICSGMTGLKVLSHVQNIYLVWHWKSVTCITFATIFGACGDWGGELRLPENTNFIMSTTTLDCNMLTSNLLSGTFCWKGKEEFKCHENELDK